MKNILLLRKVGIKKAPASIWTNPIHFIACGFGVGAIPFMPGTCATIAAIPLYYLLHQAGFPIYLLVTLMLVGLGIWICGITNKDFGTEDHPAAVWDEIASFPLTLMGLPATWYYVLGAVILFRIFDIWKPGPIGWCDRNIHGGLGVMLDDVLAALVTWGILFLITWLVKIY